MEQRRAPAFVREEQIRLDRADRFSRPEATEVHGSEQTHETTTTGRGVHEDARRAKAAAHLTGQVLQTGDVSIRVRAAGATHTVNAWSPQDYKPGQRIDVLVDGSWARLAAEPYDPVGWQMLTPSTVLPALTLLASGIRARRRDARLLRRPVPAVRAVLVLDRRGDAWGWPTDGAGSRPPLLRSWVEPLGKKAGDEAAERTQDPGRRAAPADADAQNGDDVGDEDRALVHGRPREVLIYGAPQAGAPVLLVAAVPGQGPAALRTGPLRLPRPGTLPQTDDHARCTPRVPERDLEAGAQLPPGDRVR